jgi:ribonuclease P protein component
VARDGYRLHHSDDIREVLRRGTKRQTPWFRVIYRHTPGSARFAVVVGKRLGGAVQRNRCKRRFREIFRQWAAGRSGADLVVIPFPSALQAPAVDLKRAAERLLKDENLL